VTANQKTVCQESQHRYTTQNGRRRSSAEFHLGNPGKTMNRKNVLMLAAVMFSTAPPTIGQVYTGSVLYLPMVPSGFDTVSYGFYGSVSASETVGSGFVSGTNNGSEHALLWTAAGAVDLNPINLSGISNSVALGTNGTQQVGLGTGHALLWTGTAASAVDLNPTSFTSSEAFGTNGTQQVGFGFVGGSSNGAHALLWTGTAASAVDLNPINLSGFTDSFAYGTDGSQQVGVGQNNSISGSTLTHALLWSGTAASAIDLNPTNLSGISNSTALATYGTQQVGYGFGSDTGNPTFALLWTGTAASAVDLNPTNLSGFTQSEAVDTNGTEQVGWGNDGTLTGGAYINHALLWTGTADSAVYLQTLLPSAGTWTDSEAFTIDSTGNVYGLADGTFNGVSGEFAVEWSPVVPEPAIGSLLLIAVAGMLMWRRRKSKGVAFDRVLSVSQA